MRAWLTLAFQPLVRTPIAYLLSVWTTIPRTPSGSHSERTQDGGQLGDVVGRLPEVVDAFVDLAARLDEDDAGSRGARVARAGAVGEGLPRACGDRLHRRGPLAAPLGL